MVTDPIADFITRVKNASDANKAVVCMPHSLLKESIAHVLAKSKGKKSEKTLEVTLSYIAAPASQGANVAGEPVVHGVQRVSKSSRRIYQKAKDIRPFRNGFGNVVLSTPKGIMLDVDARKQKVGGEVLFKVW